MIEVGDLQLREGVSKQEQLQSVIREKISRGLWSRGGKLPSTRKLALELSISRNTVVAVYEQLVAEGYIESRKGSGFYVVPTLPEHFLSPQNGQLAKPADSELLQNEEAILNKEFPVKENSVLGFVPGVPDLELFPSKTWQKLMARHANRTTLLGNGSLQGEIELRKALADYLRTSRSVHCNPEQVIITSGAQQALTLAFLAILSVGDQVLVEQPGYRQVGKVLEAFGFKQQPVEVAPQNGLDVDAVCSSSARALYVTPSNQYPLGTTLNTEQRLRLIEWTQQSRSWLIEDDYDSEFQFAHRPYTSMQGLAAQLGQHRVLYVGSLSKVMFNGLRLGYMVVPVELIPRCIELKDALSGASPSHTQAALADFIKEGHLNRHLRKMRRVYKAKHQQMVASLAKHFGNDIEIISQAAGLHITLKWQQGPSEHQWVQRVAGVGLSLRPLTFYESGQPSDRVWHGAVLGFGNVRLEDIESGIRQLARCFYSG